jgi:1,4-alpha-glucan branching enzyme
MKFKNWKTLFEKDYGSLLEFAHSYNKFGLNINQDGDLEYREWAPNAKEVSLFGDFNKWNRDSHKCKKDDFGVWTLILPKDPEDSSLPIKHLSHFKCCITK